MVCGGGTHVGVREPAEEGGQGRQSAERVKLRCPWVRNRWEGKESVDEVWWPIPRGAKAALLQQGMSEAGVIAMQCPLKSRCNGADTQRPF